MKQEWVAFEETKFVEPSEVSLWGEVSPTFPMLPRLT